jgi:hypothetical protein
MIRLIPKTRRGVWAWGCAAWLAVAGVAWLVAPYGLAANWPISVGDNLVGFVPDEDAILIVRHPDLTATVPQPDLERRLNRLDLRTGEVRKLLAFPDNFVCSELLASGRWLAIYRFGSDGNRVLLYEIATGRRVDLPSTTGTTLPSFIESPSGRYLAFRDETDGLRVIDLSLEPPKQVGVVPVRPGYMAFLANQFGVDDRGRAFAVTKDLSGPDDIDAIASYDAPKAEWRELRRLEPDESVNYLSIREGGEFLLGVRSKAGDRVETIDGESGRILGNHPDVGQSSVMRTFDADPLRNWLNEWVPMLGIDPYSERVAFQSNSGKWVTVKRVPRQGMADSFTTLESDDDHPYLVVADEDGVQVWNDPPRRSTRWLAGAWIGLSLLLVCLAIWRCKATRD